MAILQAFDVGDLMRAAEYPKTPPEQRAAFHNIIGIVKDLEKQLLRLTERMEHYEKAIKQ